jgi:hypothetical protein
MAFLYCEKIIELCSCDGQRASDGRQLLWLDE